MSNRHRWLGALAALLLALPSATQAAVYGARVRWQPSAAPGVAGYRVYLRTASGSYGTAAYAGMPGRNADGTYGVVLSNLDVRTDYKVTVTSYTAAQAESGRSNELPTGYAQVAPLMDTDRDGLSDAIEDRNLNRVVDAGETDPTRADTDGDGVADASDRCAGTGAGSAVNPSGCACTQMSCNDGNACNGVETCQAGVCRPGAAPSCDDGNSCTADACAPASGCTHAAIPSCGGGCTSNGQCNDGNACTTDTCSAGTCRNTPVVNGTACGDNNVCNGSETCQAGTCTAGAPLRCDDGNTCTTDTCNPTSGCAHAPNATCGACPQAVTLPPAGGTVSGETSTASASRFTATCEQMTGTAPDKVYAWTPAVSGTATISTCGAATKFDTVLSLRRGTCDAGQDLACNDDAQGCPVENGEANAATNGSRVTTTVTAGETYYIIVDGYDGRHGPFSLTVTPPTPTTCSASSCDDHDPCTTDACGARGCTHTAVAGCSACRTDAECGDGNACTSDSCVAGRCAHAPQPNGWSCSDGNFCNGVETCNAGQCTAGTAADCDDDNPCTVDSCSPGVGQCTHTSTGNCCATDADCTDRDACTVNERCEAGTCVSDPLHCREAGSCEEAACDPTMGCTVRPLPEGTACDDGDPCTDDEQCTAGVCGMTDAAARAAKAGPELTLETKDFALRRINGRSWRLSARGWFAGTTGIDPTATGLRFQILDPEGNLLWDADLPAEAFTWQANRFVSTSYETPAKESLRRVELAAENGGMAVSVVARVPAQIAGGEGMSQLRRYLATSTIGRPLTWMVSMGDRCVRDQAVRCPAARAGFTRCN